MLLFTWMQKQYFECTEHERFSHGFVLRLIVELDDRYTITSNWESGTGKYDIIPEPRILLAP